jgi:hypothetical protein
VTARRFPAEHPERPVPFGGSAPIRTAQLNVLSLPSCSAATECSKPPPEEASTTIVAAVRLPLTLHISGNFTLACPVLKSRINEHSRKARHVRLEKRPRALHIKYVEHAPPRADEVPHFSVHPSQHVQ